jgi:hypothetical protein
MDMITSFDTNDVLFQTLNASKELKTMITGKIYTGKRPINSTKEDICINTITVTRTYTPQSATSNVNIYVPDKPVNQSGQEQKDINDARLREITNKVISLFEAASVNGLSFWILNQTVLAEPEIEQHYTNLRIEWNIQIND